MLIYKFGAVVGGNWCPVAQHLQRVQPADQQPATSSRCAVVPWFLEVGVALLRR